MNYGMFNNQMNPYYQNPYPVQPASQPAQSLIRVTGLDGAKAYQMSGPNSTAALFDSSSDLMFIKSTDGAGFPTIRTFKFEELTNFDKNRDLNVENKHYVSREEMEEYVKQFIPKEESKC